jgi:hypothetical protein
VAELCCKPKDTNISRVFESKYKGEYLGLKRGNNKEMKKII